MSPTSRKHASLAIAKAFSAGAPHREEMIEYASRQINTDRVLLAALANDVLAILGARAVVVHHLVIARLLINHPDLARAFESGGELIQDVTSVPSSAHARPERNSFVAAPAKTKPAFWPLPAVNLPTIDTTSDLCELLEIHPQRLDAWSRRWRQRPEMVAERTERHSAYFTYWQPKKRGGARLIEIPKPDLKQAQRRLLSRVIERLEPHEAATGFRRGYSILDHAGLHVGQQLVLKCDLQDFFVTIRAARVHAIFRRMGYSETVSRALTAIVTSRASARRAREGSQYGVDFNAAKRHQCDHLPQGAPTSPALANLAAFNLDLRLASLAEGAGARYSRYADDLTFSGARGSGLSNERYYLRVCAIALDEGFSINTRKTRRMTQSQRQHITGLVVNERRNVSRDEFDRLKAILTNAAREGLDSQNLERRENFRLHLLGKIAFVAQVNPSRGEKLRQLWIKVP